MDQVLVPTKEEEDVPVEDFSYEIKTFKTKKKKN